MNFKVLIIEDCSEHCDIYNSFFSYISFDNINLEYSIINNIDDIEKTICDNKFKLDCAFIDLELNKIPLAGLNVDKYIDPNKCAIFSGNLNSEVIIECNKRGFFTLVQKPFTFEIFKSILNLFISKNLMIKQLETSQKKLSDILDEKLELYNKLHKLYTLQNTILSVFPASIYIKDNNLRYINCNQQFLDMNNIQSNEQIIDKTDFEIFEEEKAKKFYNEDLNILKTKIPIDGLLDCSQSRNDKFVWTSIYKYPLIENENKCTGVIGILIDVTNSIRMEKVIDRTFDAIDDGVCIVDPDNKIIRYNKKLSEFIYIFDNCLGLNFDNVMKNIIYSNGKSIKEIKEFKYENKYFSINKYDINHSGFSIYFFKDITEEKEKFFEKQKQKEIIYFKLDESIKDWTEKYITINNELNKKLEFLNI